MSTPFIYIKKVLDKNRSEGSDLAHPDTWNGSCNKESKRKSNVPTKETIDNENNKSGPESDPEGDLDVTMFSGKLKGKNSSSENAVNV